MEMLECGKAWIERQLYPGIERIAPHHRLRAMERARSEGFDGLEIAGILAAIAATTYLTRYGLMTPTHSDRFWAAIVNFVVAIALLMLIAGPFYVRRNRRGLEAFKEAMKID